MRKLAWVAVLLAGCSSSAPSTVEGPTLEAPAADSGSPAADVQVIDGATGGDSNPTQDAPLPDAQADHAQVAQDAPASKPDVAMPDSGAEASADGGVVTLYSSDVPECQCADRSLCHCDEMSTPYLSAPMEYSVYSCGIVSVQCPEGMVPTKDNISTYCTGIAYWVGDVYTCGSSYTCNMFIRIRCQGPACLAWSCQGSP